MPEVIVIHDGAPEDDQLQPVVAVTFTVPGPPRAAKEALADDRLKEQLGAVTEMAVVAEAEAPMESVTVSFAVNEPADPYWWLVVAPELELPSPKSHEYELIVPSGSVDPVPSKETISGAVPDVGVAFRTTVGGWFTTEAGSTNKETLCGGTVAVKLLPLK